MKLKTCRTIKEHSKLRAIYITDFRAHGHISKLSLDLTVQVIVTCNLTEEDASHNTHGQGIC